LPKAPEPVLPKVTQYDNDPVLRAVYLDAFQKAYFGAWEEKGTLPVFGQQATEIKPGSLAMQREWLLVELPEASGLGRAIRQAAQRTRIR